MTTRHGAEERGRLPQVFARDVHRGPDARLVRLEVGAADELRPDANAGFLRCPIDGCPDTRFGTRGGSRRDHFYHRASEGGHGAETIAHHTSKHLLASRLHELHPDAQVFPDTKETEDGARPDVYVILSSGEKLAYEVQFAPLTTDEWQRRHDRYAAELITDVWLFGGPRYLRRPRGQLDALDLDGRATVEWSALFTAIAAANRPVLFIDPFDETLGVACGDIVTGLLATHDPRFVPCVWDAPEVQWSPLPDCGHAQGRLLPAGVREQFRDAQVRRREFTGRLEHHLDWLRKEAEKHAAAEAAGVQARAERAAAAQSWARERARWEDAQGFPFPKVVDERPDPAEEQYGLTGDQWRIAVLRVLSARPEQAVPTGVLLQALELCCRAPVVRPTWAGDRKETEKLLRGFLCRLREQGWVAFAGKTGPLGTEGVCVLRTLAEPPPEEFVQDLATLHVKTRSEVTHVDELARGELRLWRCRRALRLTNEELLAVLPAEAAARWQPPPVAPTGRRRHARRATPV